MMPPVDKIRQGKYHVTNLVPALRLFAAARQAALDAGFTDNGGAIHSVERILDILSMRVNYPGLTHINNLKQRADAEISINAARARDTNQPLRIEHVMPQRGYTVQVCRLITQGATDTDIVDFIRANYRLVLLTSEEARRLDRLNRSKLAVDRIADAGILLTERTGLTERFQPAEGINPDIGLEASAR